MMKEEKRELFASYTRNFVFGVEDSLVSTVGLLSGIAAADVPRETIVLTGIVLLFVEAVSMAAGSFLSDYSAREYMARKEVSGGSSFLGGAIMFCSYFIAGFIPLGPYVMFATPFAFLVSIICSLVALFLLGSVAARLVGVRMFSTAFRMLVVGGAAIAVGIVVGGLVK